MTDIAAIILTKNEAIHIGRCLERLAPLEPRQVFVVDCLSTDGTQGIAKGLGATVVEHEWPGTQAVQFNWALDNLPIEAGWILRMDADEWLTPESTEWLRGNLGSVDGDVGALVFTLERKFLGRRIRHATNSIEMVRLFRRGLGRYSNTLMDERIQHGGAEMKAPVVFYDDNLNSLEWWRAKHRDYAIREARMALSGAVNANKRLYYRLPPYFRAFAYFAYRYFARLGFLDGYAGWMWNFWQALWYRGLVDQSISRMKRRSVMSFADCCIWVVALPARFVKDILLKADGSAARRRHDGRMVVFHVVKTLALEYGGPARSVQGLVSALEDAGVEAHLIAIEDCGEPWEKGVSRYHCLKAAGHNDVYRKMCELIDRYGPDIVHTHDCWMPILSMCHRAARDRGVKYVISPRGSLKAWSRRHKWLKKHLALMTYEGFDISRAAALHVTADDECAQVAELGLNRNIIQVTNGVAFPKDGELQELERRVPRRAKRRALFLSRIHYTKGLMNLVDAWSRVDHEGWELEIAGTDADGYQAEVERRVKALGMDGEVIFSGPVSDHEKWTRYVAADLFVHPTFTENFGIVIAEALSARLPVITTKGAPWKDLETERCGWWVEIGVEPLAEALKAALAAPADELKAMGDRGRALVVRKYSWPALGRRMREEYERTLCGTM